jgi:hypothetical protein
LVFVISALFFDPRFLTAPFFPFLLPCHWISKIIFVENVPAYLGFFFGQAGAVKVVHMTTSQDRSFSCCSTNILLDKRARHPRRPLNKCSLAMHFGKGKAEYLSPEYGTVLVNTADADHARDIRDCGSITSNIHLINGVAIAWKYKNQAVTTLHSTGSELNSLTSGVKKINRLHDFLASIGYPVGAPTRTFDDNQGTIKAICASRIHDNMRHLKTKVSLLNEQYTAGIIKLLYTKTILQLSDCNIKPLCGKSLQAMLAYLIGV